MSDEIGDPLDPLDPLYPVYWADWVCPDCAEDGSADELEAGRAAPTAAARLTASAADDFASEDRGGRASSPTGRGASYVISEGKRHRLRRRPTGGDAAGSAHPTMPDDRAGRRLCRRGLSALLGQLHQPRRPTGQEGPLLPISSLPARGFSTPGRRVERPLSAPAISRWYLESNRFGHYIVFDGSRADASHLVDRLKNAGIRVVRWDESVRSADNGGDVRLVHQARL